MRRLLVIFLLTSGAGVEAKEYVQLDCQVEVASGLYKDSDQWRSADFVTERYFPKLQIDGVFVMMEFEDGFWSCLPATDDRGYLSCAHLSWPSNVFVLTPDFSRFMRGNVNVFSYLFHGDDTAHVEGGHVHADLMRTRRRLSHC